MDDEIEKACLKSTHMAFTCGHAVIEAMDAGVSRAQFAEMILMLWDETTGKIARAKAVAR